MSRANGEGTVYLRSDGRWEAALTYTEPSGQRKRRRTLRGSREEADLALARMKVERDGGIVLSRQNPPFREWLVVWLRDVISGRVSERTLVWYEIACRVHIIPRMGGVRIRDLTPKHVASLDASLQRDNYSIESRRKIMGTLKRALTQAEAWGDIPKNPAALVSPPKAAHIADDEDEIQTYSQEDLSRLFAVDDNFHTLYVVAARTGLRQGELLALRASDLDLSSDPATLAVRRSLARRQGGGYYYTPLKNRRQRRTVALHYEAAEAFGEQLERRGPSDEDLIWPSTRGTPMNTRNVLLRHYFPALEEAGLKRLSFHALRHTFASIALYEWRMPLALVSEMLGHATPSITLDIYAHLAPGTHASEIRRVNALYSRKSGMNNGG